LKKKKLFIQKKKKNDDTQYNTNIEYSHEIKIMSAAHRNNKQTHDLPTKKYSSIHLVGLYEIRNSRTY